MPLPASVDIDIKKPGFFRRRYEFFNNDNLLASLEFKSAFNYRAIISIGNKQWQIRAYGFWNRFLEISTDQSPFTKLHLEFGWKRKLQYKDGRNNQYFFKRTRAWKSNWAWLDEKGNPVIEMRSNQLSCRNRGHVLLSQQGNEDMYLMILIGWYQLMMYESQAAAA